MPFLVTARQGKRMPPTGENVSVEFSGPNELDETFCFALPCPPDRLLETAKLGINTIAGPGYAKSNVKLG
ncbi:hypothetical protein MAPG_06087 [Magnaporthiopsis poae ATCC 64411]|uniref:Uncharacterized protein n=1 Tax=Magnaporthiopsis poae (strain ATCC 64411 / 73-15) TaxID=644358 RepID=A0A0C4E142_MAGP6|nr:hypothetical protein MAPG_06087 [Magnaporthiopsis poae ATCC 64411]